MAQHGAMAQEHPHHYSFRPCTSLASKDRATTPIYSLRPLLGQGALPSSLAAIAYKLHDKRRKCYTIGFNEEIHIELRLWSFRPQPSSTYGLRASDPHHSLAPLQALGTPPLAQGSSAYELELKRCKYHTIAQDEGAMEICLRHIGMQPSPWHAHAHEHSLGCQQGWEFSGSCPGQVDKEARAKEHKCYTIACDEQVHIEFDFEEHCSLGSSSSPASNSAPWSSLTSLQGFPSFGSSPGPNILKAQVTEWTCYNIGLGHVPPFGLPPCPSLQLWVLELLAHLLLILEGWIRFRGEPNSECSC